MAKWLLCVFVFLPLLLPTLCLFIGDACVGDNEPGVCLPLSECLPLLSEVTRAGTPMPIYIRRRLQALTCGFQLDQPLVCCTSYVDKQGSDFQMWPSTQDSKPNGNSWGMDDDNDKRTNTFTNTIDNNTPTNGPTSTNPTNFNNDNNNKSSDVLNNNGDSPPDVRDHQNLRLLPTDCGVIESDRIWGGNRTHLFEMPWMVLIAYDSGRGTKLSCGGTLINQWYVLTAAHCVSFLGNRLKLSGVVLGEYDVRRDPDCERNDGELECAPSVQNVTIDKVIAHPGYSPKNLFDDIALVRLSQPADFTLDNMKPICLPITQHLQTESLTGKNGVVAGWGATEDGLQSPVLLSVELPILANKDCQDAYNGSPHIYNKQMCAGGVPDKDSCGGDSGGPLLFPGNIGSNRGVRYIQRGIVSYGSKRCGIGGFPGVYTRIAYYMDWILNNIRG